MCVRSIVSNDWAAIHQLELDSYSQLAPESIDTLRSKWLVAPEFCFVYAISNTVVAYLLAHPWNNKTPPKLHQRLRVDDLGVADLQCSPLFLHDLVVSREHAGNGIGSSLFSRLLSVAKAYNISSINLVAVEGAHTYWQRHKFQIVSEQVIDECYGSDAYTMTLSV
ncbi:GNAT family N-acetyltransferase [Aurantivibrio plasticivorans]